MDTNPSETPQEPTEEKQTSQANESFVSSRDEESLQTAQVSPDTTVVSVEPEVVDDSSTSSETFKLPIARKDNKKRAVVWTILGIVLFILISGGIYTIARNNPLGIGEVKKAAVSTPEPTNSPSALGASMVIAEIEPLIKGTVLVVANKTAVDGTTSDRIVAYHAVDQLSTGMRFYSDPTESFGVGTLGTDKSVQQSDYNAIVAYFEKNGFTKQALPPIDQAYTDASTLTAVYVSGAVVCHPEMSDFTKSVDSTLKGKYRTSVACADKSSYADQAKAIEPLYTAYVKSKRDSIPVYVSNATFKDGASGYQSASATFNSSTENLFYKEPGKDWAFLKTTQDGLYCQDLTSPAMKQAFLGQACYDTLSMRNSVVSL